MSARRRLDWLGLTPEPERELPAAVAVLRAASGTSPGAADHPPAVRAELAAAERRRVERLVLRGSRHSWLRYLAEVTALVTSVAARAGDGGSDLAGNAPRTARAGDGRTAPAGEGRSELAGNAPRTARAGDGGSDLAGNAPRASPAGGGRSDLARNTPQTARAGDGRTGFPGNAPPTLSDDRAAALLAAEVVLDHHHMLIGLPGAGYGRTFGDRAALETAIRTLRTQHPRTGESR